MQVTRAIPRFNLVARTASTPRQPVPGPQSPSRLDAALLDGFKSTLVGAGTGLLTTAAGLGLAFAGHADAGAVMATGAMVGGLVGGIAGGTTGIVRGAATASQDFKATLPALVGVGAGISLLTYMALISA